MWPVAGGASTWPVAVPWVAGTTTTDRLRREHPKYQAGCSRRRFRELPDRKSKVVILILSGPGDLHADVLESELLTRGVAFARFDLADFPDRAGCSVTLDVSGAVSGWLRVGGVDIALQTVTAIWVRRPGHPGTTKPGFGSAARAIVAADSLAVLSDLWWLLDVRCVPARPDLIAQAVHKGRQLRRAAE